MMRQSGSAALPIPYGISAPGLAVFVLCCPQRNVFGRKPSEATQDVEGRPPAAAFGHARRNDDVESVCEQVRRSVHAEPLVMGIAKGIHDLPERTFSSDSVFPSIAEQIALLADAR